MKTTGLFLLLLFCITANGQVWQWAKSASGTGIDEGSSITTDVLGNVYVTGTFSSPTITFGSYTLINAGTSGTGDAFLVKYDASGTVLWAKSTQGAGADLCYGVATDTSENVYIIGYFYSPTITIGTYTLSNSGDANVFLAKYDASGTALWARSSLGTGIAEGRSVTTDASGNIYITGDFNSPSFTFGTNVLNNSGGLDIFLAKYDASGNVLWAKSAQGISHDWSNSVATDVFGNVYVAGRFDSPSITFETYTITNLGNENIFLVKYNSSGTVLWAKGAGGISDDWANSIATDATGNIYLTGAFSSPSFTIGTYTLTNTGSHDVFFAKYNNSSGNVLWAKSAEGTGSDIGYGVATDTYDNVYLMGRFSYMTVNSITFDSIILSFPSGGIDPMFIVKYNSSGSVLCSSTLASGGDDICGIVTDVFGNVYIGNDFMINPFIVGSDTLNLTGEEDVFVAKCTFNCNVNSINELNKRIKIIVYPNPFFSETTFKTNEALKNATLSIYNTLGLEIRIIKNISGQEIILHRENLSSGLYYIRLTQDNKIITTHKLVISN